METQLKRLLTSYVQTHLQVDPFASDRLESPKANFRQSLNMLSDRAPTELDHYLAQHLANETFSSLLLKWIDERQLKDSDVYKRANVDRRLFSRIRSQKNYHPKKPTVILFMLALHLSLAEATTLLTVAGYHWNMADPYDIIIRFCLEYKVYSIMTVNEALAEYHQPLLKI